MQVDLKEKYPKIFANIHRANYGFPKTWTNLVNSLCHEIQKYCDTHECDQVECIQIKEKFGSLRFYINQGTAEIYEIIRTHEKLSYEMCQECGCVDCDIVRTKGWISYLCKPCATKLNKPVE